MDAPERIPWFRVRRSTVLGVRLIWGAGPVTASLLMGLSIVEGLLPAAFVLASASVVAAARGGDSLTWPLAAIAMALITTELISGIRYALVEGFRHRVDGRRAERIIAVAQAPAGVAHLEDPVVLDSLRPAASSDWPDTSAFTISVFGYVSTRVIGLASAALIWSFRWWLAVALVAMWWWAGHILRQTQSDSWGDTFGRMRRPDYLRHMAFEATAAKEVRIFGFGSWLIGGYSKGWFDVMEDVWRRRRATRYRQVGLLAVVLAAHVWVFDIIVAAARSGELNPTRLVVVAPAVLAVARLGLPDHYTLGLATGAAVLPHIEETERLVSDHKFAASGSASAAGLPTREVRFESVGFNYASRPDEPLYRGLDLVIPAGKSLAIVGVNGAGKTTLVKLLTRLYEPTEGRITVDGVPLTEIDPHQWQRRVAAIFQDFNKYFLSAAENVGFGGIEALRADESQNLLDRAATRAGAVELIEGLPAGWDTPLTRRYRGGTELSGGEWQRIAMARALFAVEAGAGILVLDEPTANLDVRAEVDLFERFLEVTRGTTTVLISHRFSTVRRADSIAVLDAGRVAEQGTHDELVALGAHYARAFRLQAGRYEIAEV